MLRSEIEHADVNRSRYSHLVRELSTVITLRVYAHFVPKSGQRRCLFAIESVFHKPGDW